MKYLLLIEDNDELRENTAEILQLAGYTVVTAENGKKGIEIALQKKVDLIICCMPFVLDWYSFLNNSALRRRFSTAFNNSISLKGFVM